MSAHTPGPWLIIPGGDEWSSGRIATIEPKPETMAETNYWMVAEVNYRREEHKANANLIAAAPDLLEALRCCEMRLTAMVGMSDLCANEIQASIDVARAAIAKALTGESK